LIELCHDFLRCANNGGGLEKCWRDGFGGIFVAVFPGFLHYCNLCTIAVTDEHL
jgi:hypothetical protein